MPILRSSRLRVPVAVISVFALDQATKLWALAAVPAVRDSDPLPPAGLSLLRIFNPGSATIAIGAGSTVAFGLLLVTIGLLAIGLWQWRLASLAGRLGTAGYVLFLGGVWGNALDHLARPGAVDFIAVRSAEASAALVFNLADLAILIGMTSIMMAIFSSEARLFWQQRQVKAT